MQRDETHTLDIAFGGPAKALPNAPERQVKQQIRNLRELSTGQSDDTLLRVLQACNYDVNLASEALLDGSATKMLKQWGNVDKRGKAKGATVIPATKKDPLNKREAFEHNTQAARETKSSERPANSSEQGPNSEGLDRLAQKLQAMQKRREALERETARARAEEDRFLRELENVQKQAQLKALVAASNDLKGLMSGQAGNGTSSQQDLQNIRIHFGRLRDLVDQREKQIIKEFSEAHERVGKAFSARHATIQQTLQAVSSMQMNDVSVHDLQQLHMEIAQFTASFQASVHASSRVHFDPQQTETIFQMLHIHGSAQAMPTPPPSQQLQTPGIALSMMGEAFPTVEEVAEASMAEAEAKMAGPGAGPANKTSFGIKPKNFPTNRGQSARNMDAEETLRRLLEGDGPTPRANAWGVTTTAETRSAEPAALANEGSAPAMGSNNGKQQKQQQKDDSKAAAKLSEDPLPGESNVSDETGGEGVTSAAKGQGLPQRAPRKNRNRHATPIVLASNGPQKAPTA